MGLWEKSLQIDHERCCTLTEIKMYDLEGEVLLKRLKQAAALERYSRRIDSARRKLLNRHLATGKDI